MPENRTQLSVIQNIPRRIQMIKNSAAYEKSKNNRLKIRYIAKMSENNERKQKYDTESTIN